MTSATDPLVRVSTALGVTTLTLDSPTNRNALSTPLMTELLAGLAEAVADDTVRVVVLSHTGPVFCSGADLKETAAAHASGNAAGRAARRRADRALGMSEAGSGPGRRAGPRRAGWG